MAQLPGGQFRAEDHPEVNTDFSPIPAGQYPTIIDQSQVLPTNDKTGHYLELRHVVIDGEYKGRYVWTRLNLDNPSAKAREFANSKLRQACLACGKPVINDSEQLHGIPVIAVVTFEKGKPPYKDSNDISAWKPLKGGVPSGAVTQQQSQPETQAQPQNTGAAAPWG